MKMSIPPIENVDKRYIGDPDAFSRYLQAEHGVTDPRDIPDPKLSNAMTFYKQELMRREGWGDKMKRWAGKAISVPVTIGKEAVMLPLRMVGSFVKQNPLLATLAASGLAFYYAPGAFDAVANMEFAGARNKVAELGKNIWAHLQLSSGTTGNAADALSRGFSHSG